jgi:Putative F0F1-ATPase subunit Ca2+/Mg2+ transporter
VRPRLRRFVHWLFVPKRARGDDNKYRGEAFASGLELVVPTVVFTLLGLWADSSWGTAPLFLVVGFVFGAAGTYASQYYRYRARSEALDEGKPWSRAASTSQPVSGPGSGAGGAG